ncbi:MAG: SDR family NAD(P)-dependent oxidoreductase, partial [Alphaproteobacteria bacterium]
VGALTRCMAVEWARKGIRVLDVAPGIIITDINRKHLEGEGFRKFLRTHVPVGEPGTPDQVGKLVAALLGEDLPFLTGETIHIDGGQSISV